MNTDASLINIGATFSINLAVNFEIYLGDCICALGDRMCALGDRICALRTVFVH